ncbi:MAG: tyrosine-type recombinase/integrase [Methylophilus sp.]|uniref:tyrosine-type recombinase/integrase n=1 Tax=Methylophilus sp. TaxID=29541 RepID=UPI003FA06C51
MSVPALMSNLRPELKPGYDAALDQREKFLNKYKNSKSTHENFARETNRYLFWLYFVHGVDITLQTQDEITSYIDFLMNPPDKYVGIKRPLTHEDWKPLNGPLRESSLKLVKSSLNAFMVYLIGKRFIKFNPVIGLAKIQVEETDVDTEIEKTRERYLTLEVFTKSLAAVKILHERLEVDSDKRMYFARNRFILCFYYLTMVRISEFAKINSNHIVIIDKATNDWGVKVLGKGRKMREIPLHPTLVKEIELYHDMPIEAFSKGEPQPLLKPLIGQGNLESKSLSAIVKTMFTEIADYFKMELNDEETEDAVRHASSHWLRHTGGSHLLLNGADLVVVRDILGHASVVTTNTYLHTDSKKVIKNAIGKLSI